MTQSNVIVKPAGNNNYFDLVFQDVASTATTWTKRLVLYLWSANITDSSNSFTVSSPNGFGRSGAFSFSGVYSASPIWYQDIVFSRPARGQPDSTITASASISGVDYWGGTLSGSTSGGIPAQDPVAPSPPSGYSARNITTSDAYTTGVSVADNGGRGLDNLAVNWSTSPSMAGASQRIMGSWTDGWMTGLSPGVTYYFTVQAHNAVGWSSPGPVASFVASATVPAAPVAGAATSITDYTASLPWTPGATNGATVSSYNVQIATDAGFVNKVYDGNVVGSPYAATGLAAFTQHFWRVRTNSNQGVSAFSNVVSFTTSPGAPGAPGNPVMSAIQAASATATWTASANNGIAITDYEVQLALDASFTVGVQSFLSGSGATLTKAMSNLQPLTTYYCRVRAKTASGNGPWNATPTPFTTLAGIWIGVAGTAKPGQLWIGVGGVAKQARLWIGVGGVPK